MATPRTWGGRTLDDRTSDRREAFLRAGTEILGDDGTSAVTMRAVVRRANLSPRYFYESFDSREQLLKAVYDRAESDMLQHLSALPPSTDLRETVHAAFGLLRDFFTEDPRRARILLREPLADDTLREHSASRLPAFIQMALELLDEQGAPLGVDRRSTRWPVLTSALAGALVSMYLEYSDGRIEVDPDTMVDAAVDVVFAIAGLAR